MTNSKLRSPEEVAIDLLNDLQIFFVESDIPDTAEIIAADRAAVIEQERNRECVWEDSNELPGSKSECGAHFSDNGWPLILIGNNRCPSCGGNIREADNHE